MCDTTPIASPNSRARAESAERDTTFRNEDPDETIDFSHGEDDLIPSAQGPWVKKHLNIDEVQEIESVESGQGKPPNVRGRRSDASISSDQEGSVNVRRKRSDGSILSSEEKSEKKVRHRRKDSIRLEPQQEDDFVEWIKDNEEFNSTKRDSRSKSVASKKAMLLAERLKCSGMLKSFDIYKVILISIYT